MDQNAQIIIQLLILVILADESLAGGLSVITDDTRMKAWTRPAVDVCNQTALMLEMEKCGEQFRWDMQVVRPDNWCNVTLFIWKYRLFSSCTEGKAVHTGCYWPNPLVESYIIRVHRLFFSNCTVEHGALSDPPDDTLTVLILVPVTLTLVMVLLVVWCSKRSDILG